MLGSIPNDHVDLNHSAARLSYEEPPPTPVGSSNQSTQNNVRELLKYA